MKQCIEIGHFDMLAIGSLSISLNKLQILIESIEKKLVDYSKISSIIYVDESSSYWR